MRASLLALYAIYIAGTSTQQPGEHMFLERISLHQDWEERARRGRLADGTRWRLILLTVALALVTALVVRYGLASYQTQWITSTAITSTLYILASLWVVVRSPAAEDALLSSLIPTTGKAEEWVRALLYGLLGGLVVTLLWALAFLFGDINLRHPSFPLSQPAAFLVLAVIVRPVAEELFFRRLVLHHLVHRCRKGVWGSVIITMVLYVATIAVRLPEVDSPAELAFHLLAPALLTVLNSALYLWRGDLVAPLVSNAVFRFLPISLFLR
jgi:membrane protease YdiL (CAAX protease family)